jgi:hypothetical protein
MTLECHHAEAVAVFCTAAAFQFSLPAGRNNRAMRLVRVFVLRRDCASAKAPSHPELAACDRPSGTIADSDEVARV